MIEGVVVPLVIAGAVGSGIVGGVFFAFSTFVMPALHRLPARDGIVAMQQINITAVTPAFMLAFVGTAVVCALLAVLAVLDRGAAGDAWVIGGSVSYLAGAFILTIVSHVPRNDALERVAPDASDAAQRWSRYFREWTRMNHVRTLGALVACVCFMIAFGSQ